MNIYGKSLVVWKKNTIFAPKIRQSIWGWMWRTYRLITPKTPSQGYSLQVDNGRFATQKRLPCVAGEPLLLSRDLGHSICRPRSLGTVTRVTDCCFCPSAAEKSWLKHDFPVFFSLLQDFLLFLQANSSLNTSLSDN